VERLLPGTVRERGLKAHALQLRLQVQPRELIPARARAAALEKVRGEKADRRLEGALSDEGVPGLLEGGRYEAAGRRLGLAEGKRGDSSAQGQGTQTDQHAGVGHDGSLQIQGPQR